MNPKEKAEELLTKMYNADANYNIKVAKKCALICCDEMIEVLKHRLDFEMKVSTSYWSEVKQEIEKL